jgi:hypothetical protein
MPKPRSSSLTIVNRAQQFADAIYQGVDDNFGHANNNENTLSVVLNSLQQWQELSRKHGFELVGVDLRLSAQLEQEQREALKRGFRKRGFQYEEINEQFARDLSQNREVKLESSDLRSAVRGGGPTPHPDMDTRGMPMPLQRFFISEEELRDTSSSKEKTDNRDDYQLSLKFSPQPRMDGKKLKDIAVYKLGAKPPAPMPGISFTLRPIRQ